MRGVWIICKWGSSKNYIRGRCHTFFACFWSCSIFWILRLSAGTSHENFQLFAGKPLVYLTTLLWSWCSLGSIKFKPFQIILRCSLRNTCEAILLRHFPGENEYELFHVSSISMIEKMEKNVSHIRYHYQTSSSLERDSYLHKSLRIHFLLFFLSPARAPRCLDLRWFVRFCQKVPDSFFAAFVPL